jgi:hypothetical protein
MVGQNYPADWDHVRQQVLELHQRRCGNCHRSDVPLEVHHIVPVGQGGSHQLSNLAPLCPQCHQAAHGEEMAPRVRWFTNGQLNQDEFGEHLHLWKSLRHQLGVPRYDAGEECVYVPLSDVDKITERVLT